MECKYENEGIRELMRMADLNKTIKALEAWRDDPNAVNSEIDAYIVADALELLKEQQRKWKPDNVKGNYICGRCGNTLHTAIINPMIQYCDHCGHKVDWAKDGEHE